jgi:hypothetical protein
VGKFLTTDGNGNTYTYDANGMIAASSGASYVYDALDQRVAKTGGSNPASRNTNCLVDLWEQWFLDGSFCHIEQTSTTIIDPN